MDKDLLTKHFENYLNAEIPGSTYLEQDFEKTYTVDAFIDEFLGGIPLNKVQALLKEKHPEYFV